MSISSGISTIVDIIKTSLSKSTSYISTLFLSFGNINNNKIYKNKRIKFMPPIK